MVIIVTGVSGSGKSTVGALLAAELGWPFFEGDRFHPPENIDKMARGEPLTDGDRAPWLAALHDHIARTVAAGHDAVLACSALKRAYREAIMRGHERNVALVHLRGDFATIHERMSRREHHYMKPGMLASQFDALEPPDDSEAVIVDVRHPPERTVADIRSRLGV